ncbi:2Fe-2S iron-sulfur cluster-binding protein [Effusibacillus lacus]|uniref:2Fe-2S iron-sulfur cluster-binding protein n=1 Tax=Effusibacillus lacus TaxID=1348429 RepID=UPI0010D00B5E|nr:2Fe-2S iron-sulfur cluster-binding protein [Effusibacillus lacus]TCS74892.1 2Fe-2S ferredoxin [Effusibacillus lacus]
MKKSKVRIMPHNKSVEVRTGTMFLTAAILARVPLQHRCGGKGSCGTCKARIDSQFPLSSLTRWEERLLSQEEIGDGFRLSCQCRVTGESTLTVPESPLQRIVKQHLKPQ